MNRSFFRPSLACLSLVVCAFASGCDDHESIAPDMTAPLGAALVPEHAPVSAPVADLSEVVTMGPGAACTTHRDGTTSCTGANSSSARIAGLF